MYFIWIYNNVQTRYFKCDFLKTFMVFDKSLLLIFDQFCILTATHHQVSTPMQIAMQVHFWTILLFCELVKNKIFWTKSGKMPFLEKFSRIFPWSHLGHISLVIFGSSAKPFSGKLIQAIYQMWISFPGIVLAHDRKIKISKKMDEFSRNQSDSPSGKILNNKYLDKYSRILE